MRTIAIYALVLFCAAYAWKDWFKSLCGLILLTSIAAHPEFPASLGGIQGLNLWNVLLADIFLAWIVHRRRQGAAWDMPRHVTIFLLLWLAVILVGWVRMVLDRSRLSDLTMTDLLSEQLINTLKWPIAGVMLFDGCRSRGRVRMALVCVLLMFLSFAVQTAKTVPSRVALGGLDRRQIARARCRLVKNTGMSANALAKMMSGVPWAMLAAVPLLKRRRYWVLPLGASLLTGYALALTGGRSGFAACGATGTFLCLLRWRRCLPVLPVAIVAFFAVLPGTSHRMLVGVSTVDVAGEVTNDEYDITAGRNIIWAYAIDKVMESPVVGWGREGMVRSGATEELDLREEDGVAMAHAHNAYLEVLLDNGLIGFAVIVPLHLLLLWHAARVFRDRADPLCAAVGGVAAALLTGHLVAHMGGQSFYPRQADFGLWCAMGVMLRLHLVSRRAERRPVALRAPGGEPRTALVFHNPQP